jgi:hypothetical protein
VENFEKPNLDKVPFLFKYTMASGTPKSKGEYTSPDEHVPNSLNKAMHTAVPLLVTVPKFS